MTDYLENARPILGDVIEERRRQVVKWGQQDHPSGDTSPELQELCDRAQVLCKSSDDTWPRILLEEVLEAFVEPEGPRLRQELIQVAAVAVAWIEAIDRRAR